MEWKVNVKELKESDATSYFKYISGRSYFLNAA